MYLTFRELGEVVIIVFCVGFVLGGAFIKWIKEE